MINRLIVFYHYCCDRVVEIDRRPDWDSRNPENYRNCQSRPTTADEGHGDWRLKNVLGAAQTDDTVLETWAVAAVLGKLISKILSFVIH